MNRHWLGRSVRQRKLQTAKKFGGYASVPRPYAIWLITQILLQLALFVMVIEGVFLLEHFTDILEKIIDDAPSLISIGALLALTTPEVHYAFPVAVVAALFLILQRCRERRELVALAATGLGVGQLLRLCAILGAVAQAGSLVITGFILPYTSFTFRSLLFSVRENAISEGGAAGHFYSLPGLTAFKWPSDETGTKPLVFIRQELENGADRVITADNVRVTASSQPGAFALHLYGVVAIDFLEIGSLSSSAAATSASATCPGCSRTAEQTLQVANYDRIVDMGQSSRLEPRGNSPVEWTTAELLGLSPTPPGRVIGSAENGEFVNRVVHSVSCFLAPFLALLALTFTTSLARLIALPVACGIILCLEVVGLAVGKAAVPVGGLFAVGAVSALFAWLLALTIWQICIRQSEIIKPLTAKA